MSSVRHSPSRSPAVRTAANDPWIADLPVKVDLPAELVDTLYRRSLEASALVGGLAPRTAEVSRPIGSPGVERKFDLAPLRSAVDRTIVPRLLARHAPPPTASRDIDPHVAELARLLLAAKPTDAFTLIDRLRADGRSFGQLCAGLFEPAARALGDLWQSDVCGNIEISLGLGHLQLALRRASAEVSFVELPRPSLVTPRTVLVAPSPHEPHMLGSVIDAEMFFRAGWEVHCEFPDSDAALSQLVHERWFDVLDLSLSGVFTREHRLPQMAASIRAAHAHSLNPALTVIVDGRVFHERPLVFAEIGADAGSTSAQGLVSAAWGQLRLGHRDGEHGRATPTTA